MTEPTDEFGKHVKRQVLGAYGFEGEVELNAAVEEEFPGYLAAHAEFEAEMAAYRAELPGRMEDAAAQVAAQLRSQGMLPDGVGFAFTTEESIVVEYATDRPFSPLVPLAPELSEEQKQAAAEAASAQIEEWRRQWATVVDGGPSEEFLADLADPIRLEPKATPLPDLQVPSYQHPPYPSLRDRIPRHAEPGNGDSPVGG